MICTVNSPTELSQVEYYVRSSGVADVYLYKDIKQEFVEIAPPPVIEELPEEIPTDDTTNEDDMVENPVDDSNSEVVDGVELLTENATETDENVTEETNTEENTENPSVDEGFLRTIIYTANQVHFQISSEIATKDDIVNNFDYWWEKGKDLKVGELADNFGIQPFKESKLKEVSIACENTIYNGIDVELSTGTEHFSLTEKDQINLFGKKMQLLAGDEKMEYHEDGQPCRYFSPEDMQKIVDNAMFFVSYNTTYCNALNMWIKACTKPSELENIYWGAEIPEEHMNEVLVDYMSIIGGK